MPTTSATAAVGRTLDEELAHSARTWPDNPALWAPGQGELTFAGWARAVAGCAARLAEASVGPRQRVALKFDTADVLGLAVAQLAVQSLGASALVLPADVSAAAQASALQATRARLLVRSGSRLDQPVLAPLTVGRDAADAAEHEALVLLTSGSTGDPKLVAITHDELTFSPPVSGQRREWKPPREKAIVHAYVAGTNAFHDYLTRAVLGQMYVHVVPGADPAALWQVVEGLGVGRLALSPVAARRLVEWVGAGHRNGEPVHLVGLTGSAIDPELVRRLRALFPNAGLFGSYGLTEGGGAFTFSTDLTAEDPALLGTPMPGLEVQVVDESGTPQPPGTPGVLELRRADRRPRGVIGAPPEGGWLTTGDVALIGPDGTVRLVDRARDMVKVADRRVSSRPAEAALLTHPAVSDVAVVGVPDPLVGTRLVAAVIPREPVGPAALRAFAAERLSPPETPTRIRLLEALPLTPSGKHDKPRLRALLSGEADDRGGLDRGPADVLAAITEAWDDLLGAPRGDRDFFAQGGTSLQAAELLARIRERFGVSVSQLDLLDAGTPEALAGAVQAAVGHRAIG